MLGVWIVEKQTLGHSRWSEVLVQLLVYVG